MTRLLSCIIVATALGGCTLTGSNGQPVVLTAASAPSLLLAEAKRGCANLMVNQAVVDAAVAAATKALKDVNGNITTASNGASIVCSLLVPPPVTPMTAPTG